MEEHNYFAQENLVVNVHTPDGGSYQGIVVETIDTQEGMTRVVTDFPRSNSPALPIGDDAALIFSSTSFDTPMQVNGRVFLRSEDHFRHRYLFEFRREAVATLGLAVNQRRASRVFPDSNEPVTVFLEAFGDSTPVRTLLYDVSATGLSTVVARQDEASLFTEWKLKVNFRMPGEDEPFEVVGRVRNRRFSENGIHYGIEFDESESEDFDDFQDKLLVYIMGRQAEGFRRARLLARQTDEEKAVTASTESSFKEETPVEHAASVTESEPEEEAPGWN